MAMRTLLYILLLLIAILAISVSVSISELEKARIENARISENLEQYGLEVSTLTLTSAELRQEIKKKNAALIETDSILHVKNRRIALLEKLVKTRIVVRDTDTVYIPLKPDPISIQVDSAYNPVKYNFTETKSCITLSGFILSDDPKTKMAITERSSDIEVYDIRIRRKWWQFWRPREERFIETNCGEVEILTITKKQ